MKNFSLLLLFVPIVGSAFCFDEAGQHYNVSADLLRAIAQVESSLDPKAYNENKNEHGEIVSRDFGLMQINSSWFPKLAEFNVNESNVYEPCFNVSLGAWVLSSNFASHGYNWNSVGAYNSGFSKRTENARKIYIQKVQSVYYSANLK
ncbi:MULTISPECIES: lytic transglycosylase domain-containing protein [Vibrio]|uniref:Lytic transglycosylase domain-containing protein n=1 Tax=Vibrio parahaemolyticus TaxID=670 RepID=A0AA47LAQ4_VIBPH|nr:MULTISPECIES: lytic transglycosylase domain-containing protein [Vibrio]MBE3780017.1 lytic transglycosylase domain-containing protein [Vibrio parahaemolyticus]MBE4231400.1 lytic transglycosylase domain-containing protein [Vibrio parahaemolyticus]MCZ6249603.1 lytic transglycosylase domain-containing protein [Vibrio parahaemolyticus]MCZ6279346.1 lytic transglycosylase domain-containing protein [Vibrio parahaemolyticus]MCZ6417400.1 lytic transglycosylase domain-containing protein [Vibrio paraha